ncbi:MAG: preprotein translocase subunit SecG [Pseudomonadota bacterium]
MNTAIIIVHVIVCLALILIVLLQTGKGAGMGAAFGGGSSQTVFGGRGPATFLSKITAAAAIIFMVTSLALTFAANKRIGGDSIMDNLKTPVQSEQAPTEQKTAPAATADEAQPGPAESGEKK